MVQCTDMEHIKTVIMYLFVYLFIIIISCLIRNTQCYLCVYMHNGTDSVTLNCD
jgi:hypothetical protein